MIFYTENSTLSFYNNVKLLNLTYRDNQMNENCYFIQGNDQKYITITIFDNLTDLGGIKKCSDKNYLINDSTQLQLYVKDFEEMNNSTSFRSQVLKGLGHFSEINKKLDPFLSYSPKENETGYIDTMLYYITNTQPEIYCKQGLIKIYVCPRFCNTCDYSFNCSTCKNGYYSPTSKCNEKCYESCFNCTKGPQELVHNCIYCNEEHQFKKYQDFYSKFFNCY